MPDYKNMFLTLYGSLIKIQKEIDRLTKAARNEKQPKKKFELAQQINKLKQELEMT